MQRCESWTNSVVKAWELLKNKQTNKQINNVTRQKKGKRKKEGRKEIKKDSRGSPTTAAAATVCAHLFLLHESCLLP